MGVVAAITVPTLIQNYKEKAWNTASSVFERKLSEATKVMNTQMTLIGYDTTRGFVDELSQHMKILKTCDSNHLTDCFSDKFYWGSDETEVDTTELTTSENLEKEDYETELIGVMFANGVNAIMTYNKHCRTQDPYSNQINTTGCIGMIYDVDGFKTPNTMGKDLRGFNGVSISTLGDCDFKVKGICMTTAFVADPISVFKNKETYDSLAGNVYRVPINDVDWLNGTKTWDMDYWAAGRYACMQKGGDLPTVDQMEVIGNYIYNNGPSGTPYNPENLSKTPITNLTISGGTYSYWTRYESSDGCNSAAQFYEVSSHYRLGYTSGWCVPRNDAGKFSVMTFCVK